MQNAFVDDDRNVVDLLGDHEYHRFMGMKRKVAVDEIAKIQTRLCLIEDGLNTPPDERLRLGKDWTSKSGSDLAHIGESVSMRHDARKRLLSGMETTFGKADDLRKQIVKLRDEYASDARGEAPWLPRGFTRMNPVELQDTLKWVKGLIDRVHKREAEQLAEVEARKAHAERVAAHQQRNAEAFAKINDRNTARRDEIEREIASYTGAVSKLRTHNVFRLAPLPTVDLMRASGFDRRPGAMEDGVFRFAMDQLSAKVVVAKRGLREPLRRAWQSAHSRKQVTLDFKPYLEQEGFADLLK